MLTNIDDMISTKLAQEHFTSLERKSVKFVNNAASEEA